MSKEMIDTLTQVETILAPWQSAYGDSAVISTGVTAVHLIAMLVGGGLAIAADRTTLRIMKEQPGLRDWHLGELNTIHRPVLIAMSVLFLSGLGMVTADVRTFVTSPVLWVKLFLVALLVVNGVILERTESALRRVSNAPGGMWVRLKVSVICSIVLWIATLVAGTILVSAA